MTRKNLLVILLVVFVSGCGKEYYSTPEKTLKRYVDNRKMGNLVEIENCLDTFTDSTRKWWAENRLPACYAKFGQFSPLCGENKVDISNQWEGLVESYGPSISDVESSEVDEQKGVATLRVQGKKINFRKEKGNWKIDGLFGAEAELEPLIRSRSAS